MEKSLNDLNKLLDEGLITLELYAKSFNSITQASANEERKFPVPAPRRKRPVPAPRRKRPVPTPRRKLISSPVLFTDEEWEQFVNEIAEGAAAAQQQQAEKPVDELTLIRISWVIGNYLRGWQMNVPEGQTSVRIPKCSWKLCALRSTNQRLKASAEFNL